EVRLSCAGRSVRLSAVHTLPRRNAMQYLIQIYTNGSVDWDSVPADERQAITNEYMAINKRPGILGGPRLQPVDTATTGRWTDGGARGRGRSGSGRRCSPATTWQRPTTSTPRSSSPRSCRRHAWAALSRCGRWWNAEHALGFRRTGRARERAGIPRALGARGG